MTGRLPQPNSANHPHLRKANSVTEIHVRVEAVGRGDAAFCSPWPRGQLEGPCALGASWRVLPAPIHAGYVVPPAFLTCTIWKLKRTKYCKVCLYVNWPVFGLSDTSVKPLPTPLSDFLQQGWARNGWKLHSFMVLKTRDIHKAALRLGVPGPPLASHFFDATSGAFCMSWDFFPNCLYSVTWAVPMSPP